MKGTVLVTGASSGFGKATAERFAREGWRLVLAARRYDRLEALRENLGGPDRAHIVELDVSDRAAVAAKLGNLPAPFDEVDVLVNNAGVGIGMEPAWEADLDAWEMTVDTNIKGLLYVTRTVLPGMVARGRGHVVNMGSTAGTWPYPGGNAYGASKAFVQQLTRTLRADLIGKPIRVTNLDPGLCHTDFSVTRFRGDQERAESMYRGNDPILPEDLAEIIHWVVTLPPRVNVNTLEVMPVSQTWGALPVKPVEW